uniref:Uncharacterized protein n=1 Tax=Dasya naccarioides TaxID=2007180 RepID=A0A1Z1MGS3_9FLOR|nr:hypothetical protein [Dasya naccarioides]ARW65203.1 hypothetical protein [Dasya naccarioides]
MIKVNYLKNNLYIIMINKCKLLTIINKLLLSCM